MAITCAYVLSVFSKSCCFCLCLLLFFLKCSQNLIYLVLLSQISSTLLDEGQVKAIVDEIKQVLTASSSRKRERAERAKAEDFDAEEGELLKEENEQEEELFDQVCECFF